MLVLACALIVIYTRTRNWLDNNFPLVFYFGMIGYAASIEDRFPPYLIYIGLGLGGLLRFEFMSPNFTRVIKICEYCVLGAIVYFTAGGFFQL